jgi:hypothetical protein
MTTIQLVALALTILIAIVLLRFAIKLLPILLIIVAVYVFFPETFSSLSNAAHQTTAEVKKDANIGIQKAKNAADRSLSN